MKKLIKYELDFDLASQYFLSRIEGVNTLSRTLQDILDLEEGYFFTLLPPNSDLERINKFKEGGILFQDPDKIDIPFSGNKGTYSYKPNIHNEIVDLLFGLLAKQPQSSLILDDVLRNKNDLYQNRKTLNLKVFLEEEIYYILGKTNSKKNISACLSDSNAIWHSLGILSKENISVDTDRVISANKIKKICQKIILTIMVSYDSEGYIFWEKRD